MNIEDQVLALFAQANPVPSLDLLDPIDAIDIDSLADQLERTDEMSKFGTTGQATEIGPASQRPGLLIAAGVAVLVIVFGIGISTSNRAPDISTPLGRATAFWLAVERDDRETAIGYLDPAQVDSGVVNTFGRAHTIEGQFEWYEAVGFQWALDQCVETTAGNIECTVTGRNAWSDAIGVEPVTGVYFMDHGPSGITNIVENRDSFSRQWIPDVFDIFARWVEIHHPEDAPIMWNDADITTEGLELFRANTARFVESYPSE